MLTKIRSGGKDTVTKRKRADTWVPSDSALKQLEQEGHFDGATKSQARFNAAELVRFWT